MPRYSASTSGTGAAGSLTLAFGTLAAGASTRLIVREIKVFTLAANAARIRIVRFTAAPTVTGLTEKPLSDTNVPAAAGAAGRDASVAGTLETTDLDVGSIGAAIGSGFVYTYYGEGGGLYIPSGAANGIALIEVADTANTYDFAFIWDE